MPSRDRARCTTSSAVVLSLLLLCAPLSGCGNEAPRTPTAIEPAVVSPLEAARVLLREAKSSVDGVAPPSSWPNAADVRCVDERMWIVDVDTSALPGGYPEQFVVEVSSAGGHTGALKR